MISGIRNGLTSELSNDALSVDHNDIKRTKV